MPCVTCHVSRHVSRHMSCVTCQMSLFFFRTKWWSLSVEGLLSMGPTPSSFLRATCFFLLGGLGREVPNWKSHSDFLFSKNLFSETSWWLVMKREKFRLVKMYYCDFFKIRYLIWRYAELNRLLVGFGQIPLNIELQQDDRTVCCRDTVVSCRWLKSF